MCGIIGYNGIKNAKDVMIRGLKNLEYRGYDSAGIAVNEHDEMVTYKSRGKISTLEEKLASKNFSSHIGIGHTRWATHGKPNEVNAHPHQSGAITMVHNGIIENYNKLKTMLEKKGVSFISDTDTEVAAAYLNDIYEQHHGKDAISCLIEACSAFEGSYAFGVIFANEPTTIYATRKDSPLVLGLGTGGTFIASDVSAFLEETNQYMLLEEGEFARITANEVAVYDTHQLPINKVVQQASWQAESYQKNGYSHFMLKEIHEQPKVVKHMLTRYQDQIENTISHLNFTTISDIHIVACGSAMHAGLIGKYMLQTYANIQTTVEVASEYRYQKQLLSPTSLVIVVSQSGETADTLAALRISKEQHASTLAIVNAVGSTIAREADMTIYTHAGPEIAVATTKGYTTQVATFICLTLEAMHQRNILCTNVSLLEQDMKQIDLLMEQTLQKKAEYESIAKSIYLENDLFFMGRGNDYYIGMEGSLKLKEISYLHSECYPAGELKHGTISLVEKGTPIIAIATDPVVFEKTISNVLEVKSRGAIIVFITTDSFKEAIPLALADYVLLLPSTHDLLQPLLVTEALQLISYETALLRNCDIDQPKNLAKSVTVE